MAAKNKPDSGNYSVNTYGEISIPNYGADRLSDLGKRINSLDSQYVNSVHKLKYATHTLSNKFTAKMYALSKKPDLYNLIETNLQTFVGVDIDQLFDEDISSIIYTARELVTNNYDNLQKNTSNVKTSGFNSSPVIQDYKIPTFKIDGDLSNK